MNRLGNTNWLSNRRITQQVGAQVLPALTAQNGTQILNPAVARAWLGLVPSWIILGMVLLATLGICSTVIIRTRAQLQLSSQQHEVMASEIGLLRRDNASLQAEIHRMTTDPNMIESAARARLGMVRPNDIVVPVESVHAVSNFGTLSFAR